MRKISDEVLESGKLNPADVPEAQRMAFYCYVFLATLQELVMHYLDGLTHTDQAGDI